MSRSEKEVNESEEIKGFVNLLPSDDDLAEEVYDALPDNRYVRAYDIAKKIGISSQRVAALIKRYLEYKVDKKLQTVQEWGTPIWYYKKKPSMSI